MFIPTNDSGEEGKVIHVTGSPAIGFFLEFKRNYSMADTVREYQIVPLAQVDDQYVADTVGDRQLSIDTTARGRIEPIATMVPPPARSPNPFDPSVCISNNKPITAILTKLWYRLLIVKTGFLITSKPLSNTVSLEAALFRSFKMPQAYSDAMLAKQRTL